MREVDDPQSPREPRPGDVVTVWPGGTQVRIREVRRNGVLVGRMEGKVTDHCFMVSEPGTGKSQHLATLERMLQAQRRAQRIRIFVYAVLAVIIFAWCAGGGLLLWWATW